MSEPLASVVIPVFNRARFLGAAIDSVLAQTYPSVQVIVVDDGSTDGSADVARQRGVQLVQRRRGGVSAARNAGIDAAHGAFITFLDSDDLWPRERLAIQVDHLRQRPGVDLVLAYARMFVDRDEPPPPWLTEEWLAKVHTKSLPRASEAAPGTTGPVPHALTMMGRAELFERLGGFDTSYKHNEDTEWLMRAMDAGVAYEMIPRVLLHYRLHASNVSYGIAEGLDARLRVVRSSVARKRAGSGEAR